MRTSIRFATKLALLFTASITLVMLVTSMLITRSMKARFVDDLVQHLHTQADLFANSIPREFNSGSGLKNLTDQANRWGKTSTDRFTIIIPDGRVIADSEVLPNNLPQLENHKNRPEVQGALSGQKSHSIRYSATLHQELMYAASPVYENGKLIAVVRCAEALTTVESRLHLLRNVIAGITLLMIGVAFLMALWIARKIGQPVSEISSIASRLAGGDLEARFGDYGSREHNQLASSLNDMAHQMQVIIQDLADDKARLSSVLSNMVEGVIAADKSGKLIVVNSVVAKLFGLSSESWANLHYTEVFRHTELNAVLSSVMEKREPQEKEIRTFAPEERVFVIHGSPLMKGNAAEGALLVLHDITNLRKLENVRRDFVSNVTHELKTPLSAIKGFAETLLSGGLEDKKNRQDFVASIEIQANRMDRLVDDLLDLSAIESGKKKPVLSEFPLLELAQESIQLLKPQSEKKQVKLIVESPSEWPRVRADRDQLKQVFVNLLDNAVKFNHEKGEVRLTAALKDKSIHIQVIDNGLGIPEKDLPRLFERFYRVDKARSRDLGGTGLGLSIVKHIVEAHGGSVGVHSIEGQGSTFYFSLPMN